MQITYCVVRHSCVRHCDSQYTVVFAICLIILSNLTIVHILICLRFSGE